jgi:hypothetical protein
MPVADREYLAQLYATELAPRLRIAIDCCDPDRIAELTADLDRQQLLVLVVALASRWPSKQYRQLVACRGCGEHKRHAGDGLCEGCRRRAGSGPQPAAPVMPEVSGMRGALHLVEAKQDRLAEYAHLVSFGVGDEEAAERLGVSLTTIGRYKAALRDGLQLRFPADCEQRQAS